MKIIEKFCIIPSVYFEVTVPDLENKENYYYKPVKELQMFDLVTVRYQNNDTESLLDYHEIKALIGPPDLPIGLHHARIEGKNRSFRDILNYIY